MIAAMAKLAQMWLLMLIIGLLWLQSPVSSSWAENMDDIPLPIRMALYQAQQMMAAEKYAEAVEYLKALQAKRPEKMPSVTGSQGEALVSFTIGNGYLMLKEEAQAVSYYSEAVRIRPGFHSAWMNLAKCRYELKQYGEAAGAFLKAYESADSPKPELLYYAGVSLTMGDRHSEAFKIFNRLVSVHSQSIPLEWKESFIQNYLALEMPRSALPLIEELAEKTGGQKQKRWQEVLLYHYLALKMHKKAQGYINRLTRNQPLEPKWWKGRAHLNLQDNQYRKALIALTIKELLASPSKAELALSGDLYQFLDVPQQAAAYYERSLAIRLDREVVIKTVHSYMRLNRLVQALEWTDAGLKKWTDPRLLMLKGNLLYQQEKYDEAAAAFRSAAKAGKQNAGAAWLMAGYAQWHNGELAAAADNFKRASKFKAQKKAALRSLTDIKKILGQAEKGDKPQQKGP